MLITSLLDTDYYKFTMGQLVFHRFSGTVIKAKFKLRTRNVSLVHLKDRIQKEIDNLEVLRFKKEELMFLKDQGCFKDDYLEFLRGFQLEKKYVKLCTEKDELCLTVEGPWEKVIYFEIPLLSIINEVYYETTYPNMSDDEGICLLDAKILEVKERNLPDGVFKIIEFGTRRRNSSRWQKYVIETLQRELPRELVGTSNVLMAMNLGLYPKGTMAHEYLQACQALSPRLEDFQTYALDIWYEEYGEPLSVALSDVVGVDAFLRDFDFARASSFLGTRQDSGEPFEYAEKLISHYDSLNIDSKKKSILFSDSLTMKLALDLTETFYTRCLPANGIGTNLSNDKGVPAINIVIKMVECNGKPVAKLSDSPGKEMCEDQDYVKTMKNLFPNKETFERKNSAEALLA